MAEKKLSVLITADAKQASRAMGALEKSAGKAGDKTVSSLSRIQSGLVGVGALAAANYVFRAWEDGEKVMRQTEAVIKSTGGAANVTTKSVQELAEATARKTGVDDEAIQAGANLLLTFKGIRNEAGEGNDIFDQTTKIMVDMSVAMGTDAKGSAIQLGKALNDPVRGITALRRAGVDFTAEQQNTIKALVETGDKLGAQKVILKELEAQFGGSAEAQATAMSKARVEFEIMAGSIGELLAPAVEGAAKGFGGLAKVLGELPKPAQQAVVGVSALAIGAAKFGPGIAESARTAKGAFDTIRLKAMYAGDAISGVDNKVGKLKGGLVALGAIGVIAGLAAHFNSLSDSVVDVSEILGAADDEAKKAAETFIALGDKANGMLDDIGKQDISGLYALRDALGDSFDPASNLGQAIEKAEGAISRTAQRSKELSPELAALRGETDEAGGAAAEAAEKTESYADRMAELKKQADAATAAIKDFYDETTEGLSASIDWEESIDDLTASFKENGTSLDVTTEKGRANLQAMIKSKDAALESALAIRDQTGSSQKAASAMQGYADRMYTAARQAGLTEDQARLMIATMKLTPKDIQTTFRSNATEAEMRARNLRAQIMNIPGWKEIYFRAYTADAERQIARLSSQLTGLRTSVLMGTAGAAIQQSTAARGRATGGSVKRGGINMVGEHGPELMHWDASGRVVAAGATKAILNGMAAPRQSNTGGNVYVTVRVEGNVRADRDLAKTIREQLIDTGRRNGRPVLAGF